MKIPGIITAFAVAVLVLLTFLGYAKAADLSQPGYGPAPQAQPAPQSAPEPRVADNPPDIIPGDKPILDDRTVEVIAGYFLHMFRPPPEVVYVPVPVPQYYRVPPPVYMAPPPPPVLYMQPERFWLCPYPGAHDSLCQWVEADID